MVQRFKWSRHQLKCPEGRGEARLLSEWRVADGPEVLNGISCDNQQLKDLGGTDCQWSCWEKISQKKI